MPEERTLTEPTLADLAARMTVVEARLGITAPVDPAPTPDPTPTPTPDPTPPAAPAKPTGLACVIAAAGRPQLTWDVGQGATAWELHDLLNTAKTLQATVTEPRSTRSALKAGQHRRYAVLAVGPGGRSEMSDPIDVPPAGGQTPTPAPAPASGGAKHPFDLIGGDWYLGLPIGKAEDPKTVELPVLATYSDEWFHLNATGDGAVFRARCDGVTTKGSNYPRSELRQTDKGKLAAWDNAGAGQTLTVRQAVTVTPTVKPEVVACQIHDAKSDVIEVMTSGGRQLIVRYADGKKSAVLDPAYVLGTAYDLQIVAAQGRITLIYNGAQKADLPIAGSGWYWKVGAYVQSNVSKGDKADAFGEVVVYSATAVAA